MRQHTALSTEDVLAEVKKLQYLFQLKRVIRYEEERSATDSTESVAEHVYGLLLLARYFLPLESQAGDLDEQAVSTMILWHDIDEIETGDVLGYKKTSADVAREEAAITTVLSNAPDVLEAEMQTALSTYRTQASREARFVKAVDKFEPLVHLYTERGKALIHRNGSTAKESLAMKTPYLDDFPYIKHFCLTLHTVMEDEGYFVDA